MRQDTWQNEECVALVAKKEGSSKCCVQLCALVCIDAHRGKRAVAKLQHDTELGDPEWKVHFRARNSLGNSR